MRLGKRMRLEVKWRMIGDATTRSEEQGLGVSDALCVLYRAKQKKQDWFVLDDSRYRGQSTGFSACES